MSALPASPASPAPALSAQETALHRFRNPDPWHAPAAYWFWHRLPDVETRVRDTRFVLDQLAVLRDDGNPDAERRPLPRGLGRAVPPRRALRPVGETASATVVEKPPGAPGGFALSAGGRPRGRKRALRNDQRAD
nr:hypothetical protein [Streptomyces sabulosicollis]